MLAVKVMLGEDTQDRKGSGSWVGEGDGENEEAPSLSPAPAPFYYLCPFSL